MTLIDIGANLAAPDFAKDLVPTLTRAEQAGIGCIVITGSSINSNEQAAQICRQHSTAKLTLYSTVGIHPHEAASWQPEFAAQLKQQLGAETVVAAGECGLDFFRDLSPRRLQRQVLLEQLQLAVELQLPVFLHERDAAGEMLAILRDFRDALPKAVIHCFTGDKKQLYAYLDMDLYVGITGWICDERRGQHLHALVNDIPRGRLMIESDAPYLLPRTLQPKPRSRRNEPCYLIEVAEMVAKCRAESLADLAAHTSATAKEFFSLT